MEEFESLFVNTDSAVNDCPLHVGVACFNDPVLGKLDIPVAEVVPHEIVQYLCRLIDLEALEGGGRFFDR